MIRVIVADEQSLFRVGVRSILSKEADIFVAGEANSIAEGMKLIQQLHPDVVLLGLASGSAEWEEILSLLRNGTSPCKVIVFMDGVTEESLLGMIRAGAKGYSTKTISPPFLVKAVRAVHAGEIWADRRMVTKVFEEFLTLKRPVSSHSGIKASVLTKREAEILKLIARGMKNKEIAESLFISEKTVKTHITNIFEKLEVKDRLKAALFVIEGGLAGKETG